MGLKKLGTEQGFKTGIVTSTIFGGLSKVLLFLGTWLVSFYFGTTQNTDLIFFMQNTQVQVCGFILAVNMSVIIPRGIYLNHQNNKEATIAFYNTVFVLYALVGIVILLFFAINPAGILGTISKFPSTFLQDHSSILFFIPVAIFFNFLFQLINDVFTSFRRFTLPVLINAAFAFIIILSLVIFHSRLNEYSYLAGIIAALVICLVTQLLLLRTMGWHFSVNPKLISPKTWTFIGYTQAGQVFTLISSFLPFYLLSGEAGALSAYNIAFQLISLPSIFAISQFSVVAGIKLTEYYALGKFEAMNETFAKSCLFLLYITFPIASLLALFGKDVLERFIHFSSKDSLALAIGFISLLALTIPVNVVNTIMTRLLMASQKIKVGFVNQALQNSLLIVVSYFLYKKLGAWGLPLAILIVQATNLLTFLFIAKRFLPKINYLYVLKWFLIILLLNAAFFGIFWFIRSAVVPGMIGIAGLCVLYIAGIIFTGFNIKTIRQVIKQPLRFVRS